ncbi:MAG: putative cytokinetic ring protein SteA [Clostridiaceae bacterium]|nr:putative cytokinetic ring protein SteA [Clostridiaceae bacterium]
MKLQGRVKAGARTKNLVKFLCSGDIAVIRHDDIDEMAALAIVRTGVKAVINTGKSMTGRFSAVGALTLLQYNVKVIDVSLSLDQFKDNDMIIVLDNDIIIRNYIYKNVCTLVNWDYISKRQLVSKENENREILKFIDNTVNHAASEMHKLICFTGYPEINTKLEGRHVVVVVRNSSSVEEINALKSYIEKINPIFIGVDGGADLIINSGYSPDILIGDMDSVSDIGIYKSKEIILHAYEDGYCPCLGRIAAMNVPYKILAMRGTSEDAALMLSYHKNAVLIVLVGGHSCMYDFMCKGRHGMASTFIARTLIGSKLVDCKGFGIIAASENEGKDARWMKM